MRKKIAVFICAISLDNQRRVLSGILAEAEKQDIDVYVFTCHVNYLAEDDYKAGAFHVMQLPNLDCYDGIILMKNSIQDPEEARRLVERIRKSKTPAISIDAKEPGISFVSIDSYQAQKSVTEHLIEVHGLRRIAYVTGLIEDREARDRLRGYEDALKNHDIESEESLIFKGCYDQESGMRAVDFFLGEEAVLPEAIVCANDVMAFGVVKRLREQGVKVPEDFLVTGFDNDFLAKYFEPAMTTIDRRQEDLGQVAVRRLFDRKKKTEDVLLEGRLLLRGSCGCREQAPCTEADLRARISESEMNLLSQTEMIKSMSLELTGLENLEVLYEHLKKYVLFLGARSFYLCMCTGQGSFQNMEEDTEKLSEYTEKIDIPVAYEQGNFKSFGEFYVDDLLPEVCRRREKSTFYVVTPVFYQTICFGYCITEQSKFAMESSLYYLWMVNIGNALENIRKVTLLKRMVERLNNMWMYDTMTGLYNRGGFYHLAVKYLAELKKQNALTFMVFLDLDGLKQINDTLGHKEGDAYIHAMADILQKERKETDIAMRYGGDEFVVFGKCDDEDEIHAWIGKIEADMKKYSFGEGKALEASIGLSFAPAGEIENLQDLTSQADEKMYELKHRRKNRKK